MLAPLKAEQLGINALEWKPVLPDDLIYSRQDSLEMGFSWATYFAEACTLTKLEDTMTKLGSQRLYDSGPSFIIKPGKSQLAHYSYIDNLGIWGENAEDVKSTLKTVQDDFNEKNLDIHEVEFMPRGGSALGVLIDG